ncbi:MAG: DUF2905 family protein [Planctomycetota bacterium]|nr:MAG: DUF2905 family protein [Planctomycetota bacterium]
MLEVGRTLFFLGLVLLLIGGLLMLAGRVGFRGLPGDIYYESDHVRVYIPIVSSLLLSLVLSAMLWIWQWLANR